MSTPDPLPETRNGVRVRPLAAGGFADASLAPLIDRLNAAGWTTIASCSGLRRDHPADVAAGTHRATSGYLGLAIGDRDGRERVRTAARAAGLTANEDGQTAFWQPGVTVRVPRTRDGMSHGEVVRRGSAAYAETAGHTLRSLRGTDAFMEALEVRDGLIAEIEAAAGGRFDATDSDLESRWKAFVHSLGA